ncbi:MAG: outer membrane beta-barrel protein [Flavobacteriales bacterium]
MQKIIFILIFLPISLFAQKENKFGIQNYFGFQTRMIIPSNTIGPNSLTLTKDYFTSTIEQKTGYTFGGVVRLGLSELISIETGLNYIQRIYGITMQRTDSNIVATNTMHFIQYDIPVSAVVNVKLTKSIFANASLGLALQNKPSSVGIIDHPNGKHEFFHIGLVDIHKKMSFDLAASAGFEYRTKKSGVFYIGGSARVAMAPVFQYVAKYKYVNDSRVMYGNVNGSYLSLDFKYFLPYKRARNLIFKPGPIE